MTNANFDLKRAANALDGDQPARPNDDHDLHELLTVDDVAALLKVSRRWVYEHTRARGTPTTARLPHVKVGKYVRFEPQGVRDFLAKRIRIA